MTTGLRLLGVTVALMGTLATSFAQKLDMTGIWAGELHIGGTSLRLVMRISKGADGSLAAKLDSPDQNAKDIPVKSVTVVDGKVKADVTVIGGVYEGDLNEKSLEIKGNWKQGGQSFPLNLKKTNKVPERTKLNRPQVPKKPYPYEEEVVTFENKTAGVKLEGTLTKPKTGGPFPAVLLVAGSGPNQRDEEILEHPVFKVLADYLTRNGFAVLRYDKRGVGKSTGSYSKATTRDFADDALAGVAYLESLKEIQPKNVSAIGHSEGGLIVPILATESDVKSIVMMAGPGIDGGQIMELQGALINKAEGMPDKDVEAFRHRQKEIFAAIREAKDDADLNARLDKVAAETKASMSAEDLKKPEVEQSFAQARKVYTSIWTKYFITYDPVPTLKKVKCPVLALNGEKDLQVPIDANLPVIEAALKEGGNTDYTIKRLPNLNHLFQTCKTGSPTEYGKIEETLSPKALKIMTDWLKAHTKG